MDAAPVERASAQSLRKTCWTVTGWMPVLSRRAELVEAEVEGSRMSVRAMTNLITYRGGVGQLSFILHRVTGLGILLFLVIHVVDTSTVFFFPSL